MDKVCCRCLAFRYIGLRKFLCKGIVRSPVVATTVEAGGASAFNFARHYATKERTSVQKYKHGKLITGPIEDPKLYPHLLLVLTGYDESVLETYYHFAKKAAKIVEVNLTKSFNMPAKVEIHKAEVDGSTKKQVEYKLKQYQRVIELQNLTADKSDIYIEYLQKALPPGVDITMEPKRWEMHVDPNHISLRDLQ